MSNFWKFIILIVSSYLIGNVTFARLFAFTRNKDDITTHGSGNPGTMNVLRTHGLWLAVVTLIFDALKSVIVCLWGYLWLRSSGGYAANFAVYCAGFSCMIGHCYPILYRFKGGKGVATGFGLACVARPILIPFMIVFFLAVFLIWKIGSFASLTSVIMFLIAESVFLLINGYYASFILLVLAVTLIFYAHRRNIRKIFDNKESKIDLNEAVQKDRDYAEEQRRKREKIRKSKQMKNNGSLNKDKKEELVAENGENLSNAESGKVHVDEIAE